MSDLGSEADEPLAEVIPPEVTLVPPASAGNGQSSRPGSRRQSVAKLAPDGPSYDDLGLGSARGEQASERGETPERGVSRFAPNLESYHRDEHHEWALKMWKRMDRDESGVITRQELDCEEFRSVIRSVVAPWGNVGMGGSNYARAEMNMNQAINFCLRKADLNNDNSITFKEFKAFMKVLRQEDLAKHTANLIFALFDLDGDQTIDESEFREIYRFYLGHNPVEEEFQEEWGKLDERGDQRVTRQGYIRWLSQCANPIFRQHAPPPPEDSGGMMMRSVSSMPPRRTESFDAKPLWNQRFNTGANANEKCPQGQRSYFSRPQSLPELTRHFDTHRGFGIARKRVRQPDPKRKPPVLSTDNGIGYLEERALPRQGLMKSRSTGKIHAWEDHWQKPVCVGNRYQSATLLLRCPGAPPKWLYEYKCEDD